MSHAVVLSFQFEVGERVRIEADEEKAKRMQRGHGGWNEKMRAVSENLGVIFYEQY